MNDLAKTANAPKAGVRAKIESATAPPIVQKSISEKAKLQGKAEKKLQKLEVLQSLCERYQFLKEKSDDLNAFMIGRDRLKETLIIQNADGRSFEVSNSRIVEKMMLVAQDELFQLLEKAENDIAEFNF